MSQATGTISRKTLFSGNRTFTGDLTLTNNLSLNDNSYLYFGTGNDGYIYSNGTNAYASLYDLNLTGTLTATGLITANAGIKTDENFTFDGAVTTSNKGIGLVWTGWDKETTADFSDNAYIKHTTNLGGITGSVLLLGSLNDATDGIAFITHADSDLMHNGNIIYDAGNLPAYPTVNNATLTLATSGVGLSGSDTFTSNQSSNTTFTVTSNATSANTASTIVARDASKNFSANDITTNKVLIGNGSATIEYNAVTESIDFIFS